MKKNLLTALAFISVGSVFAQLPVSTSPQNRKAVIEEFTGIYCGYCPDGHQVANAIKTASPTQVVLVNIHSGGFANVATGEPDLKTAEGNAIDPMTGMLIAGYPAGDVNRTVFAGISQTLSGMAQNRNTWAAAAGSITSQSSFCNVALQGTLDVTTRVLTVIAQVYYTANSPVPQNSLTVFLLEDKIIGPQHNYGNPYYNLANYNPDGSYNHNHALRKGLTPTFGINIPTTTTGTTFTTQLTYTIPATYGAAGKTTPCNLGNLDLAAFVTQSNSLTVTGANGPIVMTNFPNATDLALTNLSTPSGLCSGANFASSFKFSNLGSTTVTTAVFSYVINGGAPTNYTWTGSVNPQTQALTINLPTVNVTPLATNSVNISVVSVNGATDQVPGNNTLSNNSIGLTTYTANSLSMQMDFTQDRYGNEDSWKVYDEATNAIISQDGPWSDLGATGVLLHTKTFTISPNTCYKLVVSDAYGDGVNSGYGAGGYSFKSGGVALITSNGSYGFGTTDLYKSANISTGINANALNISGINLFPNPTSGLTNLSIELTQNETVGVTVINSIGQEVYSSKSNNLNAGLNNIGLNTENWATGVYFINVSTQKGSINQKLTVTK